MKYLAKKFQTLVVVALVLSFIVGFVPASATKVEAAQSTYWIKVNKQANVATVYKLTSGTYKPIKAMLTSCGGSNTPSGTYYTPAKYRWKTLMGPSYGQYSTRIHGGILFHSVWYYSHSKSSQSTVQFNKLGQTASHGCVRLSVADAKWIYDNCSLGTKVTIYSSSNPGPLGKPKAIKVSTARKMYWDPTDPDPKNPYARKPVITISKKKAKTVQYGTTYNLRSGVTAKDGKTKESLTSKIKYSVKKYSKKKYRKATFSTKSLGTYKITYTVTSTNKKKTSKTFKVKVVDTLAPVISGAISYYTHPDGTNAVNKTTAKLRRGTDLTSKMEVYITLPGAKTATKYTYAQAKAYKFAKSGVYTVKYVAKNTTVKPNKSASATIYVHSVPDAEISLNTSNITITEGDSLESVTASVYDNMTITDKGIDGKGIADKKKAVITVAPQTFVKDGSVMITVTYTGQNGFKMTKTGTVTVKEKVTEASSATTEQATTEKPQI